MQSAVNSLNLIVDKYHKGHMKSHLKRKLTDPEIALLQATKTCSLLVNIVFS